MKRNIPFFSLARQWKIIKESIFSKVSLVLDSNQFVGGPYVAEFEKQFARYTNSTHAIACNSGTDSLWLALKALDVQKDDIVLTTPFSFIASGSEIVAHGAHPVFIDIDESTYNLCPKKLAAWLTENTKQKNGMLVEKQTGFRVSGIVAVDIFGQCFDYPAIKQIADAHNLWIVEDACQAIGAHIDQRRAGTLGDISCFSLYPTKNLGACGDGGVIVTSNETLATQLHKLRNHGRTSNYDYECYGRNSRMDAVQAVIVTEKLRHLNGYNKRRQAIAHSYTDRLSKLPFIQTQQEITGHHVYHQYCVRTPSRDALRDALTNAGIGTNIFYPKGLHQISFMQTEPRLRTQCPITEQVIGTVLALPIWPELTDNEIAYICETIERFTPVQIHSTRAKGACSQASPETVV